MNNYYEYHFGKSKKMNNIYNDIKIAMFDLDFTLIKPKKGKFPKDENDWIWLYDNTKNVLIEKSKTHYIVIVSNQNGIKTKEKLQIFEKKLENIYNDIKIPFAVYVATLKNEYRKPNIEMWNVIKKKFKVDNQNTFYVGDAAGRTNDFSDSDIQFAKNINVKFYTPEEFFLNEQKGGEIIIQKYEIHYFTQPTMIILMGPPATGKSTFYSNYLSNYDLFSQDIYKTKTKLVKELMKNLMEKKTCVVEGLLYTKEMRQFYISLGKEHNYKIHLIFLDKDLEICKKNNDLREKKVPCIVYSKYNKYFEEPSLNENIDKLDILKN
jgi:bifunctional polynucleotide phosphatase/kinase